jgi:hypothetical protein
MSAGTPPKKRIRALSSDAAGELDVLGHDGHSLGVGVLKERDEVGLRSLLKGEDGSSLESEVVLEVLSDLTDETLEGKLRRGREASKSRSERDKVAGVASEVSDGAVEEAR